MIARAEAIKGIMSSVKDELVIATTGMISRELFMIKDRPENFYMCGSMGNALPIGLGIALHTKRKVIVLDGDGAVLMSMGSIALANYLKLDNLTHIVLDNAGYASTGNQPSCSQAIDFSKIGKVKVIKVAAGNEKETPRISLEAAEIKNRFIKAIRNEREKRQ